MSKGLRTRFVPPGSGHVAFLTCQSVNHSNYRSSHLPFPFPPPIGPVGNGNGKHAPHRAFFTLRAAGIAPCRGRNPKCKCTLPVLLPKQNANSFCG
jgi:hypothetical protein